MFWNIPTLGRKRLWSNIPLQLSPFIEKLLKRFVSITFSLDIFIDVLLSPLCFWVLFSGSPGTSTLLTSVVSSQVSFYLIAALTQLIYSLLCKRLSILGFHATTLFWFLSYLTSSSFNLISWFFIPFLINVGVLQLSDLGPHLSLIHIHSPDDLIQSYGFKYCKTSQASSFIFSWVLLACPTGISNRTLDVCDVRMKSYFFKFISKNRREDKEKWWFLLNLCNDCINIYYVSNFPYSFNASFFIKNKNYFHIL